MKTDDQQHRGLRLRLAQTMLPGKQLGTSWQVLAKRASRLLEKKQMGSREKEQTLGLPSLFSSGRVLSRDDFLQVFFNIPLRLPESFAEARSFAGGAASPPSLPPALQHLLPPATLDPSGARTPQGALSRHLEPQPMTAGAVSEGAPRLYWPRPRRRRYEMSGKSSRTSEEGLVQFRERAL